MSYSEGSPCVQVKNARGEWITAAPVPGTFVCNVGDMLRVYSNGSCDCLAVA